MSGLFALAGASVILAAATAAWADAPQRTTATYDDWTVRCEMRGAANICEMAQTMQIKGQAQPISQIAIGRQGKNEPLKIVFEVPINVWLRTGVTLKADEKYSFISASYSRCLPMACFADIEIKDDVIKKLRALKTNGKLQFKDAGQQDIAIPVSFKGFGEAYDAMQKP